MTHPVSFDPLRAIGLVPSQREHRACQHAAQIGDVTPSGPGCAECLEAGGRWVHLRICMTCGHVGCCDASPNRHATMHHRATGHPIIRSLEPGEWWAWCYEDEEIL